MVFPKSRFFGAIALLGLVLTLGAFAGARGADRAARVSALKGLVEEMGVAGKGPEASRLATDTGGYLKFVGSPQGASLSAPAAKGASPKAVADAFVARWRPLLTDESPSFGLEHSRTRKTGSRTSVKYRQTWSGLPVLAAQAIVQVRPDGQVACFVGDLMREAGPVDLVPTVMSHEAAARAVLWATRRDKTLRYTTTAPELMVYAPEVIGKTGEPRLVWHIVVTNVGAPRVKESVYMDAHKNAVAFHYPLLHSALSRTVYDAGNVAGVTPGTLVRSEGEGAVSLAQANTAYEYLGDTYAFYANEHGRDSLDNAGYQLSATVRYVPYGESAPYENAFWNGSRMYFGDGMEAADDVVAHELTHGVTSNESNLIYSGQSGAINESFSDMWGEWTDLTNGAGNDSVDVRWQLGEDLPAAIGVVRNMADPTLYGDPDRMNSPNYYTGALDYGGVHTNSGVGNKLCYLLTDGDTFNGQTVTGMGISKVADLFYECQTSLLTSGADYADLYLAATQAAINQGWNTTERENLRNAFHAVEIFFDGPENFVASSSADSSNVSLSWTNPSHTGFQSVIVRVSTSDYPTSATEGDAVYSGTGTSTTDSGALGVARYYAAWAVYADNEISQVAKGMAVPGEGARDYFTEDFTVIGVFDLAYKTLTLVPDSTSSGYRAFLTSAASLPTSVAGATVLSLDDDDHAEVTPPRPVSLFGESYSSFFVSSNGYITFGQGDYNCYGSLSTHFGLPRVSAMFTDLSPNGSGTIDINYVDDRVAVSWVGVPEWGTTNSNTFQVEMFYNGTIRMTWLLVDATIGTVGISPGDGTPGDFTESDLSSYSSEAGLGTYQALSVNSTGLFYAGVWNYTYNQWAGSKLGSGSGVVTYYLSSPGQWSGAYLYDMDAGAYEEGYYIYREE